MKNYKILILIGLMFFLYHNINGQYSGYTIGIDPGHGGSDPGAQGYNGSTYPDEADINLDVGIQLKTSLEAQGANVGITRANDSYISLTARVNYINSLNPDAYISIHCNSFSDASANGTETYWHTYGTTQDKLLATKVQNRLVESFQTTNRGIKHAQFTVLSVSSSIPAVLGEMVFISNQSEFNLITSSSGKQSAVTAFDKGIKDFLNISSLGYVSVNQGVQVNPASPKIGESFSVSFTLKETNGGDITFEKVAVAILRSDNTHVFDLAMYEGVSFSANDSWSRAPSGILTTDNLPGSYKAVIRGRVSGGNWFDFSTTESAINPHSFTVTSSSSPEPDLIVEDIWTIPANPIVGEDVDLHCKIKNVGNAVAESYRIRYYIDDNYVDDDNASDLAAGGSDDSEKEKSYEFTSSGNHVYKVIVDQCSSETNNNNNSKSETVSVSSGSVQFIINEFLADPPSGIEGDANGDGERDSSDDEFIEIVNKTGREININGFTLSDKREVRHVFASISVKDGKSVVVFGGGTPSNEIPGITAIASTGGLRLNNDDKVILKDASGNILDSYDYDNGGDNQSLARSPDYTGNFVKHSTISSNSVLFSPGKTNSGGINLPVELTTFTATSTGSATVVLNWQTATEVNNYGFEIEQQILKQVQNDDNNWEEIGFVNGHGNSNSPKDYTFVDTDISVADASTPLSNQVSYRLKQIDIDGSFEYSDIVTVELDSPRQFKLSQNYPNPFNPTTMVSYSLPTDSKVKIEIFNTLGQSVAELVNGNKTAGYYESSWEASNLPSGIYLISIKAEGLNGNSNFSQVKKALLLK